MNKHFTIRLCVLACASLLLAACGEQQAHQGQPTQYPIISGKGEQKKVVGQYTLPSDTDIDKATNAAQIRYGQRLLNETKRLLPDYVGADMSCNSCHIAGGKVAGTNPYVNSYNSYPRHMPRPGREIYLVERINGCFQRSMNGKPLPRDGEEMQAMLAYMQWLGQGVPKGQQVDIANAVKIDDSLIPNPERGRTLYATHCAACHGSNGEGKRDDTGAMAFPPLWGEHSFNIGAGMARTYKAAAFVKAAMPMSISHQGIWGQGGLFNDQDAVDIAEFFTHQPRPDFAGKKQDWPNGNKPKDARY